VFLILISQGIYLVIIIFSWFFNFARIEWWIMFGGLFGGVLEWFEILRGLRD
jgi:hypothetical protein